jgi:hypothetical protein
LLEVLITDGWVAANAAARTVSAADASIRGMHYPIRWIRSSRTT